MLAAGGASLAGALALVAVPGSATAAEEPGSGLSSFSLAANAPAVQVRQVDTAQCGGEPAATGGCEGVVPEAVSTLRNGPVGYALSSVVWPGTLAGNLGSLLIVAGNGQVPEDAKQLNSPVRAEARTGGDGKPVVNESYPGTVMTAQATASRVSAKAVAGQDTVLPVGTAGKAEGSTATFLEGATTAVSEARSHVSDLSIAGIVTIESVTSTARATTDGTRADATGSTVTQGVEIAGVPVVIDGEGVSVAGQGAGSAAATAVVNSAISAAGMTIAVGEPQRVVEGATASYTAGSLVFAWTQQPGVESTVVLGGARVSATAAPAFSGGPAPVPTGGVVVPGVTDPGPLPDTGTAPRPVVPGVVEPAAPPAPAPPVVGGPVPVALAPSGTRSPLPDGLSPAVVVLGLVGVGLLAGGFRRLPDRVLEAPVTACPLEETP
jgi:hypothetical protein